MQPTHQTTVPFSRLIACDDINARPSTKEGLDALASSIEVKGVIQPLAVRLEDAGADRGKERYQIIDGRRRYLALQRLVKDKVLARDTPVPVIVRVEDDAGALETSLMANVVRLPMHPVDQHAVMAKLADEGLKAPEIAARFGIAERTVQQQLALGRLAPEVREAWRKGKLDAKTAQAFAVHPDQALQADVLKRLGRNVNDYSVRSELSGTRERADQSDELALIGEEAYLAAGGKIEDDLFDDARYIVDVPLARKLAREKLEAECAKLRKAGWAWAEVDLGDRQGTQRWDCDHVRGDDGDDEQPPESYSKAERKKSGCIVGIGYNGEIEIGTGLVKRETRDEQTDLEDFTGDDDGEDPGELPRARALADIDPEPEQPASPFEITQALTVTIHEALTVAAADVLRADPLVALQVLVAQLETSSSNGPVKIDDHGNAVVSDRYKRDHQKRFSHRLRQVRDAETAALLVTLADRVAQALSMVPSGHGVYNATTEAGEVAALRDYLPGGAYLATMRERFGYADYFARARKETAIAALTELHDAGIKGTESPPLEKLQGLKKGDLAQVAAACCKAAGWLPPELRHPEYVIGDAPVAKAKGRGKR